MNFSIKGKKYKLKLVTQEVECEIVAFNKVIDATTLETYENARGAKTNDVAEVTIKTKEKICFDKFAHDQNIGRFVLVDVISIDEYCFENRSTIDENGFGINLTSQKDVGSYIDDFEKGINAINTNKWINFTKYRTIKFRDIIEETPEYII